MPKFSIITQCFLGEYPRAAKDRDIKLVNAVNSVLNQSFKDLEMIIVADGCEKTFEIISEKFDKNDNISCFLIPKQTIWSGTPRNIGKLESKGDYCLYLDADDFYGRDHLKIINENLRDYDWVWYCDLRARVMGKNVTWYENPCFINRLGFNGTSNVCFKRYLDVLWPLHGDYGHDFRFNQELLRKYPNQAKIRTPQYHVCHIPDHPGGKGYDIINQ